MALATTDAGKDALTSPEMACLDDVGGGIRHETRNWQPFSAMDNSACSDEGPNWQTFDEDRQGLLVTTEGEETSGQEEEEEDGDVWTVTPEQREYYTNQFRSLQPDISALIMGPAAKEFFEKSKLPVQELSKIWQLSDINKDGALSLEEFCTAMHLVVLRRNHIRLPDVLPSALVPRILPSKQNGVSGSSPHSASSPHSKEWTRFGDSPNSSISSPGIKPVNFDFQKSAVEQDPLILHPVPLRVSPEASAEFTENGTDLIDIDTEPVLQPQAEKQKSPVRNSNNGSAADSQLVSKLPPPPQQLLASSHRSNATRKTSAPSPANQASEDILEPGHISTSSFSGAGTAMGGLLFGGGPKKDPPPPPPPRPTRRNHARSSSLDLNRLSKPGTGILGAPPAVPPRMSPSANQAKRQLTSQRSDVEILLRGAQHDFAQFAQFPGDNSSTGIGAFEIYKRPNHESTGSSHSGYNNNSSGDKVDGVDDSIWDQNNDWISASLRFKDKKEVLAVVEVQRDRNTLLSRLNAELNQELLEAMEERTALEMQLEHMRSFVP